MERGFLILASFWDVAERITQMSGAACKEEGKSGQEQVAQYLTAIGRQSEVDEVGRNAVLIEIEGGGRVAIQQPH